MRFGLDFENQELLVRIVRKLDSAYMKWVDSDMQRQREAAKRSK